VGYWKTLNILPLVLFSKENHKGGAMLEFLSPSALASAQDEIIATPAASLDRGAAWKRLERFEPMLTAGRLSGLLPSNNLKLRNLLIFAGLCESSERVKRGALIDEASRLFRSLLYPGNIYSEGLSYLEYVRGALAFLMAQNSDAEFLYYRMAGALSNFEKMAAPDGSVPFTDTRADSKVRTPAAAPGWTRLSGYSVLRKGGSYLFVAHNPEIVRHRKNQHVAPDFGHFAFWRAGEWVVGHPWYTGYKEKKSRPGQERDYLNVPRGNWNSPLWRWMPAPRLEVLTVTDEEIRLRFDAKTERIFRFAPGFFLVEDVIGKTARQTLYAFGS
jgi:hypothetical protein